MGLFFPWLFANLIFTSFLVFMSEVSVHVMAYRYLAKHVEFSMFPRAVEYLACAMIVLAQSNCGYDMIFLVLKSLGARIVSRLRLDAQLEYLHS